MTKSDTKTDNKSENAFQKHADLWHNECVSFQHPSIRINAYIDGYKNAAERLVDDAMESRSLLDTLIFPIVFLYRHYLELQLKGLISQSMDLKNERCDYPKTHDLNSLWKECKKRILNLRIGIPENNPQFMIIDNCIDQFSIADHDSTVFRYTVNKHGKDNLDTLSNINVRSLKELLDETSDLLENLQYHLEGIIDNRNDMRELSYGDG